MNRRIIVPTLAAVLSFSTFACDKSPEKAQAEAQEAQRQADMKQSQAYQNADKESAKAQNEAMQNADQARATLVQAQQDLSSKTEERLGKYDTRVIDLRGKIAKATALKVPRAELEKKLDDVIAQCGQARTTLAEAQHTTDATQFAGTKAKLDAQVDAIDDALSGIEKAV
jgi:hypothetical protein